ncbi:MAG: hypothetical protein ACKOCD_00470, partial [Nitrospiraceae bacterium]
MMNRRGRACLVRGDSECLAACLSLGLLLAGCAKPSLPTQAQPVGDSARQFTGPVVNVTDG